jgi:hypothetical protein
MGQRKGRHKVGPGRQDTKGWAQDKKAGEIPRLLQSVNVVSQSSGNSADIYSLGTFRAALHLEAHLIAFVQGTETLPADGAVMNENIAFVFSFNETKALLLVKPLNSAFRHFTIPFFAAVFRRLTVWRCEMLF